jgi:HSP20 family protein
VVEIRYDRLSSIQGMQRQMEKLLDYLGSSKPPMVHFARLWEPAVDVYETEENIVVLVELAGVRQDRLEVVVEGSTLIVRGERKEIAPGGSKTYYQIEIHRGRFERVVPLPAAVDPDKTRAAYEDGLLEVVLPRAKEGRVLRLKVRTPEEC